jgi:dipeptidyl aminopeptidase/acylaminoacyl peptidase
MGTDSKMKSSARFPRYTFLGTVAALLVLAAPAQANAQSRKIELGDVQKIVSVSSPAISPDGESIVVIISRVNWDEDRHDSQLVLVDIATGADTNSYAMYHALKDNGVTVKFIAIPTTGHDPSDPVHQSDIIRVSLDWFDQYLK